MQSEQLLEYLVAKLMNIFRKDKINPLIGAAGVSAVPMAARVVNKVGLEYNSQNHLLMHAMGPNIAGVIGSAVAAGVMIKFSRIKTPGEKKTEASSVFLVRDP